MSYGSSNNKKIKPYDICKYDIISYMVRRSPFSIAITINV